MRDDRNLRWHPRDEGELPGTEPTPRRARFRVENTFGVEWSQRRAWRERYGGVEGSPELLERRLDVALHRSGLRNSIRASRQVVQAGLARVNGEEARPGQRLYPGDRVTRERWPEWAERSRAQFARWSEGRCRPIVPWLEVDWTTGAFVRVYEPSREEIYRPRRLGGANVV